MWINFHSFPKHAQVEESYTPSGWLGLILGTRLWYPFWESAVDTETKFTQQMDAVARELGDRYAAVSQDIYIIYLYNIYLIHVELMYTCFNIILQAGCVYIT